MDDQQHLHADQPKRDEDTRAILHRRRFLIKSALAGIGAGAVLAGCDKKKSQPAPRQCLSISKPDTQPATQPQTQPATRPRLRPCLKISPE